MVNFSQLKDKGGRADKVKMETNVPKVLLVAAPSEWKHFIYFSFKLHLFCSIFVLLATPGNWKQLVSVGMAWHAVAHHFILEMTKLAGLFGEVESEAWAPPRYLLVLIGRLLQSRSSVRCGSFPLRREASTRDLFMRQGRERICQRVLWVQWLVLSIDRSFLGKAGELTVDYSLSNVRTTQVRFICVWLSGFLSGQTFSHLVSNGIFIKRCQWGQRGRLAPWSWITNIEVSCLNICVVVFYSLSWSQHPVTIVLICF